MVHDEWRELYASLGFATIPLRARAKRPLRKGWLAPSAAQWAGVSQDANIGILTGAPSGGLVVLDFDSRDGPETMLGMTPAQLAVVTIVVETSRGWHVYTRAESCETRTVREGVDLRGEGAMVVAPPSVHPSGFVYRLMGPTTSIVRLDALAPALGDATGAPETPDLPEVESWIALQAPKLRDAWRRLKEPSSLSFDASKADFAISRCLWEAGYSVEAVATILTQLPGSRAKERGWAYAMQTATRARVPRR